MNWNILDTGAASAIKNMEIDIELLKEAQPSPVLHLYDWERPSATYGYFIEPEKYLRPQAFEKMQLAQRPTGGGIIFHVYDFAFSIIIPSIHPAYSVNTLENYAYVNSIVIKTIEKFFGKMVEPKLLPQEPVAKDIPSRHFCMAKPTKYDVMIDGKKVGGAAQRRTKTAFLHQGTISLAIPDENFLNEILLPETYVHESMMKNTYALLPSPYTQNRFQEVRQEIRTHLISCINSD